MVFVDDAVHAVFAVCAVGAVNPYGTFLHGDVGFGVLAVLAGLAGEADMAFGAVFAVLTVNGNAVLAVLAGNGDAVLAVNAYAGFPVPAVYADMAGGSGCAVLAVFAVDCDVVNVQVSVHYYVDGSNCVFAFAGLGDDGLQVFTAVAVIVLGAGTHDVHTAVDAVRSRVRVAGVGAEVQAVVGSGYLMGVAFRIGVFDAGNAVGAGSAVLTNDGFAPDHMDVADAVLAVLAGRACQADVAYAVLTVDGYSRFAVLAILAVYGDAVLAVDAYAGYAVFTVYSDVAVYAVLTVFARAADGNIVAEFYVKYIVAVCCLGEAQLQVAAVVGVGALIVRGCGAFVDGNFCPGCSGVLFQLAYVDHVGICFARCHVVDLVAAEGYVAFVDDDVAFRTAVGDGHTFIVDDGIAHGNAAFFAQVDIFIQFYGELAVFAVLFRHYADIAGGQVVFVLGFAYYVDGLVQLHGCAVAEVAGILHAVVQGGYRFIVDDDAGDAVFAVYAGLAVFGDGDGLDLTVFTGDADSTGGAVLTLNGEAGFAGGAVLAVDYDGVNVQVTGQFQVVIICTVFVLGTFQCQVAIRVRYRCIICGSSYAAYADGSMPAVYFFNSLPYPFKLGNVNSVRIIITGCYILNLTGYDLPIRIVSTANGNRTCR